MTVGVETAAAQASVRSALVRLGVPEAAVEVSIVRPVRAELTLQDRARPPVGGQKISHFFLGLSINCTLGFGAIRQGVMGFVTASHCSLTQGLVDGSSSGGTIFNQPTRVLGASNMIGIERVDPPFFMGGTCPASRRCRWSDALFAEYLIPADRGIVAQPNGIGSIVWDGASRFPILRERRTSVGPLVGEGVAKVGQSTGYTEGFVTRVGVSSNQEGTNITFLAQAQASYDSASGDSGAAVLSFPFADYTQAELVGLHRASSGAFSPIGNIQLATELGSMNTCAAPYSC